MNKRQPPGRFGPMLGLGNRRERPIGEAGLLCSNLQAPLRLVLHRRDPNGSLRPYRGLSEIDYQI